MERESQEGLASGFNWLGGLASFGLAAGLSVGGFALAYLLSTRLEGDPLEGLLLVLGLVFGLFFAALAQPYLVFFVRALGRPVILRIDQAGLFYAIGCDDAIPWDKVLAVAKTKSKFATSFNVYVDPAILVRTTFLSRLLGVADQNMMVIADNVVKADANDVHMALARFLPEEKRRNMPYWTA